MARSNAERQKQFRERRNALAKGALDACEDRIADLLRQVERLSTEVADLRADLAERDARIGRWIETSDRRARFDRTDRRSHRPPDDQPGLEF